MKRILLTFLLVSVGYFCFSSDTYHGDDSPIKGPQGDISFKITLPKGFNPATDRCKIQRSSDAFTWRPRQDRADVVQRKSAQSLR